MLQVTTIHLDLLIQVPVEFHYTFFNNLKPEPEMGGVHWSTENNRRGLRPSIIWCGDRPAADMTNMKYVGPSPQ